MPGGLQLFVNHQWQTYEVAAEDEANILQILDNSRKLKALKDKLWKQKGTIESLVRRHLQLNEHDACSVLAPDHWIAGGFNICILVEATYQHSIRTFVFRCPMPHRAAEGDESINEKLNCEAATYMWMQEYCPNIRVPKLYAFGFTNCRGFTISHFTHINEQSLFLRVCHAVKQWYYRLVRHPLLSNYSPSESSICPPLPYLLLEYIKPSEGEMLSNTWAQHYTDEKRRTRLYRGVAQILLSLAKVPQPHIGSFHFDTAKCTVTLSNRPLLCAAGIFESTGTAPIMKPRQVYQNTDSFASDVLTLFDRHFLEEPHSVQDEDDARQRITIRLLLRAVTHHFILPQYRNGPFIVQPTDLSQSNILVDKDWNITCLLDLEWISALPVEMLSVPYWFTCGDICGITGEQYERFDMAREHFLAILQEELQHVPMQHNLEIISSMRHMWSTKGVWFWACLRSVNAWLLLFEDHVLKRFSQEEHVIAKLKSASALWLEDSEKVIRAKVEDEVRYQEDLKSLYNMPVAQLQALYDVPARL